MELNKLTSLDKSRSYSRTETEDTLTLDTKKTSISSSSSDDKNIKQQQPTEIRFSIRDTRDRKSVVYHVLNPNT